MINNKGDFLLHYRGELIDIDEADHREHSYDPKYGSFMYFFFSCWKDNVVSCSCSDQIILLYIMASSDYPHCRVICHAVSRATVWLV